MRKHFAKTLDTFIAICEERGAKVRIDSATNAGAKMDFRASSPDGGCMGLGQCNCSPGLWVEASQGGRRAWAEFHLMVAAKNPERGQVAAWSTEDAENWNEVLEWCGPNVSIIDPTIIPAR